MQSSGTTAISTSGDAAVTLMTATPVDKFNEVTILNEGAIAGFFSVDGGTTWARLPAGPSSVTARVQFTDPGGGGTWPSSVIQVKRIPSGTDLTGLWAFAS